MKGIFSLIFVSLIGSNSYASCNVNNANEILNLIKKNHPKITLNAKRSIVLEQSIEVANQVPNPELDAQTSRGLNDNAEDFSTSLSIKHTFELGGKRDSRVNLAKTYLETGKSLAIDENENTIIDVVKKMNRLRQVYELIPLYEESLDAFNKILRTIKRRKSLSPEKQVERETLALATNDYKLKIARLQSEKVDLNKHLSFFMGSTCKIPQKALPYKINLNEKFEMNSNITNYSKLKTAKFALEMAKANLALEKSNAYSNLQVGPTYGFDKLKEGNSSSVGVAITIDLPLLNTNAGGKLRAAKEVISANSNLKNVKDESVLDLESWITKYNHFKRSLRTIANKNDLEKKHQRIEALFRRGIISTSLVIESHRQLIEFSNTRFDFEQGAIEALWNIYKINGDITNKAI